MPLAGSICAMTWTQDENLLPSRCSLTQTVLRQARYCLPYGLTSIQIPPSQQNACLVAQANCLRCNRLFLPSFFLPSSFTIYPSPRERLVGVKVPNRPDWFGWQWHNKQLLPPHPPLRQTGATLSQPPARKEPAFGA